MARGPGRVARRQGEALGAARQRLVDDRGGDQDAVGGAGGAAGRQEDVPHGRRLDAHAGPLEQRERGGVDGLDRRLGPEVERSVHTATVSGGRTSTGRRRRGRLTST